jgi:hypothetical protein
MSEVPTDTDTLLVCLIGRARRAGITVAVSQMIVDEIDDCANAW